MCDHTGQIVLAEAGRDRGGVFCVVGADGEGRLLLADGKRRKAARPKAKKPGHVRLLTGDGQTFGHPVIEKLKAAEDEYFAGFMGALPSTEEASLVTRIFDAVQRFSPTAFLGKLSGKGKNADKNAADKD